MMQPCSSAVVHEWQQAGRLVQAGSKQEARSGMQPAATAITMLHWKQLAESIKHARISQAARTSPSKQQHDMQQMHQSLHHHTAACNAPHDQVSPPS